ncbi:unnamed protein product [Gadus morhua 'NCC']
MPGPPPGVHRSPVLPEASPTGLSSLSHVLHLSPQHPGRPAAAVLRDCRWQMLCGGLGLDVQGKCNLWSTRISADGRQTSIRESTVQDPADLQSGRSRTPVERLLQRQEVSTISVLLGSPRPSYISMKIIQPVVSVIWM